MKKYIVTRDVTPEECHWLKDTVAEGTVVYRYDGFTYGLIAVEEGIPVSRTNSLTGVFFEMPKDSLISYEEF